MVTKKVWRKNEDQYIQLTKSINLQKRMNKQILEKREFLRIEYRNNEKIIERLEDRRYNIQEKMIEEQQDFSFLDDLEI